MLVLIQVWRGTGEGPMYNHLTTDLSIFREFRVMGGVDAKRTTSAEQGFALQTSAHSKHPVHVTEKTHQKSLSRKSNDLIANILFAQLRSPAAPSIRLS